MAVYKGSNHIKEVDDTQELVQDFTRRTPFWSYRSVSYKDYEPLMNLTSVIDEHLERLIKNGEVDDGNGNVLDSIIFDVFKMAVDYYKFQRVNHKDANHNFQVRVEGDICAFNEELKNVQQDLDYINREYNYLMKLYWNNEYGEVEEYES